MTVTDTNPVDRYLADFEKFEGGRNGKDPAWIRRMRRNAIERFAEMGFPTLRHEEWKYTNVRPITQAHFLRKEFYKPTDEIRAALETVTFGELECTHLVFVDGNYAPDLSRLRPLPKGTVVGPLARALGKHPELLEGNLGRHLQIEDSAFAALNTAFLGDGAFIYVPKKVALDEPIHLLFVSTSNGEACVSYPRNLIVGEPGSQATVVENYLALGDHPGLTNAVTEVVGADDSVLHHVKLQRENENAYHVSTLQAHSGRNSTVSSHSISLGGALVRNDANAVLDGEGAHATLNGLFLAAGKQHVDNHTFIDHAKPHCDSHELYKGVLAGSSHGVFNGKIRVREDAQKTDAKQTNKNLLLSEEALVDTKPQLEIFADDVKCTHGATVGQLDEESLFYLLSRGIGVQEARGLLIHAFACEIIERVPVQPLRTGLECVLMTKLPAGLGGPKVTL